MVDGCQKKAKTWLQGQGIAKVDPIIKKIREIFAAAEKAAK
jgi:hypothetical protein